MDAAVQAAAIAKLAPPAKVVDVPRFQERGRGKKQDRKPAHEGGNAVAKAMAKAMADKAAKDAAAKANGGLPAGAEDLTATVE
jgi:hypothetical protein